MGLFRFRSRPKLHPVQGGNRPRPAEAAAKPRTRKPASAPASKRKIGGVWGMAFGYTGRQVTTGWGLLTGRISLLNLIQENLLFTLFLTGIGLVYIWNSHQAERQAREATQLEREIRELKTEYMTLNAQLSISRQQSRVEALVDSLGLEAPQRPPIKLEVKDE